MNAAMIQPSTQRKEALIRAAVAIVLAMVLFTGALLVERNTERNTVATPQPLPASAATTPATAAMPGSTPPEGVQATEAPAPAVPTVADGYMLQLGVFGNPANANTLQAELVRRGLPARIESRVVLGPYPDRIAAETAQTDLRREGRSESIIVPPRGAKQEPSPATTAGGGQKAH